MTKQFTGRERVPLLSGGLSGSVSEISPVRLCTRALSNAEIRHLHSSPIQMLPAPGVGLAYILISSVYQNVKVGASISSTGPGLFYSVAVSDHQADGADGESPMAADDILFAAWSNMTNSNPNGFGQTSATMFAHNASIVLGCTDSDPSAGGGYGRVSFLYYVIPVQLTPP